MDLGDVITEHLQRNYQIIDDEETTGYLRKPGDLICTDRRLQNRECLRLYESSIPLLDNGQQQNRKR